MFVRSGIGSGRTEFPNRSAVRGTGAVIRSDPRSIFPVIPDERWSDRADDPVTPKPAGRGRWVDWVRSGK